MTQSHSVRASKGYCEVHFQASDSPGGTVCSSDFALLSESNAQNQLISLKFAGGFAPAGSRSVLTIQSTLYSLCFHADHFSAAESDSDKTLSLHSVVTKATPSRMLPHKEEMDSWGSLWGGSLFSGLSTQL